MSVDTFQAEIEAVINPDKNSLLGRLRAAREKAGLSQNDAAKAMGMHRPTISQIEGGYRRVTVEEAKKFAELYGVEFDWLTETEKAVDLRRVAGGMTPDEFIEGVVRRTRNPNVAGMPLSGFDLDNLMAIWEIAVGLGAVSEYVKKGLFQGHSYSQDEITYRLRQLRGITTRHATPTAASDPNEKATVLLPTSSVPTENHAPLVNMALGLVGESIEFLSVVVGAILTNVAYEPHTEPEYVFDAEQAIAELGDVAWYHAACADLLGKSLPDVWAAVEKKLAARYLQPDGSVRFHESSSVNRPAAKESSFPTTS